ncbi:MAG TPA: hypothetical protein VEM95_03530 [Thermoplasmata archaeon]|nr:hypothetical protein [Thermoplasmata archaeon]
MSAREISVARRMWRQLGFAFVVMAAGLGTGFVGLAWDFYEHQIVGLSPATESLLAPAHVMIFLAIPIGAGGFLIARQALRHEGYTALSMLTA